MALFHPLFFAVPGRLRLPFSRPADLFLHGRLPYTPHVYGQQGRVVTAERCDGCMKRKFCGCRFRISEKMPIFVKFESNQNIDL